METPLSTRRVTKSNNFFDTKAQEDKPPLIDITNDSPIVGLAMQTPSPSGFMCKSKNKSRIKNTPGSGEALLRGQVKTLLNKVEEEEEGTELISSIKSLPFIRFITSPIRLLAPTPANSPQLPNNEDDHVKIASPVLAGNLRPYQASYGNAVLKSSEIYEEKEEKSISLSRSLLFDFTEKGELREAEDEDEEVDRLCEGMKKDEHRNEKSRISGKHSRLVYKGEDEEEIIETKEVLHLRFATKEEEEESIML